MSQDNGRRASDAAKTPSRRDFLKTSSVAAAAGAVGSTLSIARSAHAASDDTIKIALIGCGGRGTGACSQALSTEGPVKLVAMADAFRDRLDGSYNGLKRAHNDRVDVPEDRGAPQGRKVHLHVALVPAVARVAKPDPLFLLENP